MRGNIDTERIIRTSGGRKFHPRLARKWAWRVALSAGRIGNPEFISTRALSARGNGGHGTESGWVPREGGVVAAGTGIRAIGSSFGDIFFAKLVNGILPVIVDKQTAENLAAEIEATQGAGKVGRS
jgi:3-isopropylmalate/(R)-2-methylmalate dehydratase small subunit